MSRPKGSKNKSKEESIVDFAKKESQNSMEEKVNSILHSEEQCSQTNEQSEKANKESKLTKEQKDKKNKIKDLMRDINKEAGDSNLIKFGNEEPPKESVPFDNKYLDEFLGGGAVYGNFVIFWGSEGVGKTTLAYLQIAAIQRRGKIAAYLDLEHSFDATRAKLFGVNVDELLLIENANTAEEAMDIFIKLAKSNTVDLIVIDSIQAMTPKEENVEGKAEKVRSMEEKEIAALAKVMGKFLRRTATPIYKSKCGVIMIGQARTGGIGTFITKDDLTGGRAIKFWSLLTAYMRKGQGADAPTEKITDKEGKKKEIRLGFDCVIVINKTKKINSKPELSELHIPYYFASGFENEQM